MIINYEQLIKDVGLFGQVHYYNLKSNPTVIYVSSFEIKEFDNVWSHNMIEVLTLLEDLIDPNKVLSKRERVIYAIMKAKKYTKATLAASLGVAQLELINLISNYSLHKTTKFNKLLEILGISKEVLI